MKAKTQLRQANGIRGVMAACALMALGASASHGAIIKLTLGEVGPDVGMGPTGVFSTVNDGNVATLGDQDTSVEFTGGLNFLPDVPLNVASFSIGNVQSVGLANVFGSLVVQNFAGGTFSLYDPANVLLLSGSLTNTALTGTLGAPATGSLFSTTLMNVTGGTLMPFIAPGSVSLSLEMTNVNGGTGLSVVAGAPLLGLLGQFLADATLSISGNVVPEPATVTLLAVGGAVALGSRRRRV